MDSKRHGSTRRLGTQLASELKVLLSAVPVGSEFTIAPSSDLCSSLELLIPRLLRRRHSEWERESLDGIFVARALRTGSVAAELVGTCILISDQTVTPFCVEVVLSTSGEHIEFLRVRLGEPGAGRLGISGPDCNSGNARKLLATVVTRLDDIAWAYEIAIGGDASSPLNEDDAG